MSQEGGKRVGGRGRKRRRKEEEEGKARTSNIER